MVNYPTLELYFEDELSIGEYLERFLDIRERCRKLGISFSIVTQHDDLKGTDQYDLFEKETFPREDVYRAIDTYVKVEERQRMRDYFETEHPDQDTLPATAVLAFLFGENIEHLTLPEEPEKKD